VGAAGIEPATVRFIVSRTRGNAVLTCVFGLTSPSVVASVERSPLHHGRGASRRHRSHKFALGAPLPFSVVQGSNTVVSTAASTRRKVDADGRLAQTYNACGAVAAHWAIATQEPAPAITACRPSRSTDC